MSSKYARGSEWRRWDLHVHTASSYDSKYKGNDADQLLCDALIENDVAAVAITDHFLIDPDRIKNLRSLAPGITFFPGVELRTDKMSKRANLHLNLIFSEQLDVDILAEDFNAIMLRINAKEVSNNDTIHWTFEDIIKFAKAQKAFVSIHAGRKTSGLDRESVEAVPVDAIKRDMSKYIDFFEVGTLQDIEDYKNIVFKNIPEKPIIICSDCHDPRNYAPKEKLWVKANPTFEGLIQCLYQPEERIYVGMIPPSLDRERKSRRSNISKIATKRTDGHKNSQCWFDFELELNSGLVAIIGNKGSGKSALSDILGHLSQCKTIDNASFLNNNRFRKLPQNLANDYEATLTWGDGYEEVSLLSNNYNESEFENAQYLPQRFIEDVCNELGGTFQNEINRVIFSYVDKTELGSATNFHELIANKSEIIITSIKQKQIELRNINSQIILLEDKKTSAYLSKMTEGLNKVNEDLERHSKLMPKAIEKPAVKSNDDEYQTKLNNVVKLIEDLNEQIDDTKEKLININNCIEEIERLISSMETFEEDAISINARIKEFIVKYKINGIEEISVKTPKSDLLNYLKDLKDSKKNHHIVLNGKVEIEDTESNDIGLLEKLIAAEEEKRKIISSADEEEKTYQKYLADLEEWEDNKQELLGDKSAEGTIEYFKAELDYLNNKLCNEYSALLCDRKGKIMELFNEKKKLALVFEGIYGPVEQEICHLLDQIDEDISFEAEAQLVNHNLSSQLLEYVNKSYSGIFSGKTESLNQMNGYVRKTDFGDAESVLEFIEQVMEVVYEEPDVSSKKINDKEAFYYLLCSLEYINVAFKLKVGGRDLEELSPGERGIVLLIFYLALSKENSPIIIDQPEDNLDNQSVYSKLVPCICAAKKKRQVIIVTHNPNIAVACDAEQIVYCSIDKKTNTISYEAGAIEDQGMKDHVVDVLEGTMPAFDLRSRKYLDYL